MQLFATLCMAGGRQREAIVSNKSQKSQRIVSPDHSVGDLGMRLIIKWGICKWASNGNMLRLITKVFFLKRTEDQKQTNLTEASEGK